MSYADSIMEELQREKYNRIYSRDRECVKFSDKDTVNESTMIFRTVTQKRCIVSNHVQMEENLAFTNDFKFKITVKELGMSYHLLKALDLDYSHAQAYESIARLGNPIIAAAMGYTSAFKDEDGMDCEEWFLEYMQSFGSTHQSGILKEPLRSDDVLSIMVTDKDMQVEVFNALQKHRKV